MDLSACAIIARENYLLSLFFSFFWVEKIICCFFASSW
uniref:Uncharacterized protein n=1 Tax=Rhizophora mucronata TaxID=61149 RepID=A0A2P2JJ06_RHIMU